MAVLLVPGVKSDLTYACVVLTFNFLSLTLKLVQALGTHPGASASNPDTLAGREEKEVGFCCPPAKDSLGLQEAFNLLRILSAAKKVLGKSDPCFGFTLIPYKACNAT